MTARGRGVASEWQWLTTVAHEHGDAFYVMDLDAMAAAVDALRRAWESSGLAPRLAYSVKTNPMPLVLKHARALGMGAEVASGLELWLARRAGFAERDVILTGVARDESVLHDALAAGATVVLDGLRDVELALAYVGDGPGAPGRALLRLRVPTDAVPEPRLGMTPEAAASAARRLAEAAAVDVVGLHSHSVDRSLPGLAARLRTVRRVAAKVFPDGPPVLDLGSCVPVHRLSTAEAVWRRYAELTAESLDEAQWHRTQVVLEPGAPVVSHAAQLAARVLDVRAQPGRTVVTVAASILNSSPIRRRVDLPVRLVQQATGGRPLQQDPVAVAGGTLIDGDWLALDLPWSARVGDFVVIDEVGAYSIGLDTSFIEPPLAVVVREGPSWSTARRRPTYEEVVAGFTW